MNESWTDKIPGDAMVIIRNWQLEACKDTTDTRVYDVAVARGKEQASVGDRGMRVSTNKVALCAAALLNFFGFDYDNKRNRQEEDALMRQIAEKHGDEAPEPTQILTAQTMDMLERRLLFLYSKDTIREAVERLKQRGFITTHKNPNPRYKFDQTTFYRYELEAVNAFARGFSPKAICRQSKGEPSSAAIEMSALSNTKTPSKTPVEKAPEVAIQDGEATREQATNQQATRQEVVIKPLHGVEQSFNLEASPSQPPTSFAPPPSLPPEAIYWNANCGKLRKVIAMNPERQTMLAARRKEGLWVSNYAEAVKRVAASEFCNGGGSSGWRADFKWMLKPNTMAKIMEGTYDNRGGPVRPAPTGEKDILLAALR